MSWPIAAVVIRAAVTLVAAVRPALALVAVAMLVAAVLVVVALLGPSGSPSLDEVCVSLAVGGPTDD